VRRRSAFREDGLLYRQMGYLIASGAKLNEVMDILVDESGKSKIKRMAQSVAAKLAQGTAVAQALAGHSRFFNKTLIYMLAEKHDKDKVSAFLYAYADEIERAADFRLNLLQTLIYPAKVLLIALLIVVIMMVFVVPVFNELFSDMSGMLPQATRIVIASSSFMRDYFIIIVAVIAGLFVLVITSRRTVYAIGRWIPGIKTLLNDVSVYSFARFLSLLLPLNRPLPETLQHVAYLIHNQSYGERITATSRDAVDMNQFKVRAQENRLFPNLFFRTLEIGQRTQTLDQSLDELARYYNRRISKNIEILRNILETASIVIVGVIVGVIVISLYLPIFSLAGAVGG
jgi:type IV pilus assembly protein PilC